MNFIPLPKVSIQDPVWRKKQRTVMDTVLPYQWDILNDRVTDAEPSHCISNFRIAAGLAAGTHYGMVFQDTDLYKWLEAASYSLILESDAKLEKFCDDAIVLIEAAQCEDGYLHTYHQILCPEKRWTNLREAHEMYCAGHLMEAAVAYWQATGKDRLLRVACRFADHIDSLFGLGKQESFPGHPEIELGLLRLYSVTQESRYLKLTQYFVEHRGRGENPYEREKKNPAYSIIFPEISKCNDSYYLVHAPLLNQLKATGHAVRAVYLYAAAAELAAITGHKKLEQACRRLFDNIVKTQMHVTGGIGSSAWEERFTVDYDLPPESAYCESCASVGLTMLAARMWELTSEDRYYDIWERALFNTVLAGMGEDGRHFFYVNPLLAIPEIDRMNPTLSHVLTRRQKWFGTACCPPNIARLLLNIGSMLYARQGNELVILTHISSEVHDGDFNISLSRKEDAFALSVDSQPIRIRLRVPDGMGLSGLASPIIEHRGGKAVYHYHLTPRIRILYPNPKAPLIAGKGCVACGPVVYCIEETDNPAPLGALWMKADTTFRAEREDDAFYPSKITAHGFRELLPAEDELYTDSQPVAEPCEIRLIPYSYWANRTEGEMSVWLNVRR